MSGALYPQGAATVAVTKPVEPARRLLHAVDGALGDERVVELTLHEQPDPARAGQQQEGGAASGARGDGPVAEIEEVQRGDDDGAMRAVISSTVVWLVLVLPFAGCSEDMGDLRRQQAEREEHWSYGLAVLEKQMSGLELTLSRTTEATERQRAQVVAGSSEVRRLAALLADVATTVEKSLAKGRRTTSSVVMADQEQRVVEGFKRTQRTVDAAVTAVRELPPVGTTEDLAKVLATIGNGTELDALSFVTATLDVEASQPSLLELERRARFCRGKGSLELLGVVPGSEALVNDERQAAIDVAMKQPMRRRRRSSLFRGEDTSIPIVKTGPIERMRGRTRERLAAVVAQLNHLGVPMDAFSRFEVEYGETDQPLFWVGVTRPCGP